MNAVRSMLRWLNFSRPADIDVGNERSIIKELPKEMVFLIRIRDFLKDGELK